MPAQPSGSYVASLFLLVCLCPPKMAASGRVFFFADERIDKHQPNPHDDRRIGDIEGRPMPLANVEIGEIEDRSPTSAVDNIADGASHDKADAPAGERAIGSAQPHEEPDTDRDRDRRQKPRRQRTLAGQQAEAHAAIPYD